MAFAAVPGFLVLRPMLFDPASPARTLADLVAHEGLARLGIALELLVVVAQALTALGFYRLFRHVDELLAATVAVFGLVNAVAILASAALLASALQVAVEPSGSAAGTVQVLYVVSENLWGVGAVFFGLWLLPMGACVLRSGWMPTALGRLLLVGGAGYVLSAFTGYLVDGADWLVQALTVPATTAEFWMIGYLLLRGVDAAAARRTLAHPARSRQDTAQQPSV